MNFTSTYKIVIFGDSGSGKTTLTHRFMTNLFKEDSSITIGVEFQLKAVQIDGENVKLQIWDFAGEERFRFLFPSYIRGANGAIFMYDITNYGSLAHVDDWFEILENEIHYKLPIIFVGGKTDLIHLKENYYFIPKFIDFQYPQGLDSRKPAIVSVRSILLEFGLLDKDNKVIISESLSNGYVTIKDKDKDKVKGHIIIIINYLNEKTGKKYRHNSKVATEKINARINEGFTVGDFIKVIDNKSKDPYFIKNDYMRPETLFGNKFESYLNWNPKPPDYSQDDGEWKDTNKMTDEELAEYRKEKEKELGATNV